MGKKLIAVLVVVLMGLSLSVQAQCPKPTEGAGKVISKWYVLDGDTLDVGADKRLRLASINTPELGRSGAVDQPQAQAAKQAVVDFMQANKPVYWQADSKVPADQQRDRYGRYLGMVYNAQGEWLAEQLVRDGLAFVLSIPPYVAPDCLWQQEAAARAAGKGIWSTALAHVVPASKINADHGGFVLVAGKVSKVASAKQDWYVELDGDIALRINKQQWLKYAGEKPDVWLGKRVQARGWLAWRPLSKSQRKRGYKHGVMSLSHPHMVGLVVE